MPDPKDTESDTTESVELEDTVDFVVHGPDENPHNTTHEHTDSDGHNSQ